MRYALCLNQLSCEISAGAYAPFAVGKVRTQRSFHISQFSSASAPLALPSCGSVRPPESLLTPDPLPNVQTEELAVRVSFIVGVDGHVHSAFVLESGGSDEDEVVLRTVRLWRYRPALCNGVPTDSKRK